MIAFDTNLLLRLLLDDSAHQARQAEELLRRTAAAGERVLLPDIVLCELEWVLESVYGFKRADISQTIERLLAADEFAFLDRSAVGAALQGYSGGKADFSDYLIGESASAAGAVTTYTFDRKLARSPGFSQPG